MAAMSAASRQLLSRPYILGMVRIAISQAAFNAIAATLPLGSVGYAPRIGKGEVHVCDEGERLVDHHVVLGLRNLDIRSHGRKKAQEIFGVVGLE